MAIILAAGLAGAIVRYARRISVEVPPPPNYENASDWLCRPTRADPCSVPTTATILEADGRRRTATYRPDPAAPIDCFYLYPTVSSERAAYASIAATDAERRVARTQLARFASVCRPFAPLYRQVTSHGLPLLFGGDPRVTIDVPYADALAAWRSYLAHDNKGRGVVLIGHSQGARLLARLIAEEIDGKAIQARLVSAIIPGTRVVVPEGAEIGGTYRHVSLCTRATQIGCVIAYSSYPASESLPPDARFGRDPRPGMRFACVDPAALAGTAHLDADLPLPPALEAYGTDFIELPALLSAACRRQGVFTVLAISVGPRGGGGGIDEAGLKRIAHYAPAAGLHMLDINLALGTFVDLVRKETTSYARP